MSPSSESRLRLPYTERRSLRLAVWTALGAVGILVLSLPAWAFDSAENLVWTSLTGGVGAVLIGAAVGALVNETLDPVRAAVQEALSVHSDRSNPESFRAAIHEEVTQAVSAVTAGVDFAHRAKLFERLRLAEARSSIAIQSISLSSKWQMAQILERALNENPDLTVRILLLHPYSEHATSREHDLTFPEGTIRGLISETLVPLSSLRAKADLGDRLQVRGYRAIPYYGLICVDDRRLVLSLSREGRGGDQNMGAFVEASTASSALFMSDLLEGFDERWRNSTDLLETVSVTFLPGSERQCGSRVAFQIKASAALDQASVVCSSSTSRDVQIATVEGEPLHYEISGAPVRETELQRFEIVEAIATETSGWLRSPVSIPLPSLQALRAQEPPDPGPQAEVT